MLNRVVAAVFASFYTGGSSTESNIDASGIFQYGPQLTALQNMYNYEMYGRAGAAPGAPPAGGDPFQGPITNNNVTNPPCFVAGTLVNTVSGRVPIEQIKVGDAVLSYNTKKKEIVTGRVKKVFVHKNALFGVVTLEDGTKLGVTPEHPFWSPDKEEWIPIGEFRVGENVLRGKPVAIRSLDWDAREAAVYNIHVKRYKNYFVDGVLVHNKMAPPDSSPTSPTAPATVTAGQPSTVSASQPSTSLRGRSHDQGAPNPAPVAGGGELGGGYNYIRDPNAGPSGAGVTSPLPYGSMPTQQVSSASSPDMVTASAQGAYSGAPLPYGYTYDANGNIIGPDGQPYNPGTPTTSPPIGYQPPAPAPNPAPAPAPAPSPNQPPPASPPVGNQQPYQPIPTTTKSYGIPPQVNPSGAPVYDWGQQGASGNRNLAGAASFASARDMFAHPYLDPTVQNAITQSGMDATRAQFAGQQGLADRHRAITGNSAGYAAGQAQAGREQAGAYGMQARQNQIDFEKEAQRRKEAAQGQMQNLYQGESQYQLGLMGGAAGVDSKLYGSASSTRARTANSPMVSV